MQNIPSFFWGGFGPKPWLSKGKSLSNPGGKTPILANFATNPCSLASPEENLRRCVIMRYEGRSIFWAKCLFFWDQRLKIAKIGPKSFSLHQVTIDEGRGGVQFFLLFPVETGQIGVSACKWPMTGVGWNAASRNPAGRSIRSRVNRWPTASKQPAASK